MAKESSKLIYIDMFKKASKFFTLQSNKVLIERIDLGEVKTAGGIFLAEPTNVRNDLHLQKPHIGVVIALGQGYFDSETNSYVKMELELGNVVLLNNMGVQYYSTLPGVANYSNNKVGLTTEGDVQMVFKDIKTFKSYVETLGGSVDGI